MARKWRVAESLLVLRTQLNSIAPNRSKLSDGTIGDANHASRASDHNPWVHDPATKSYIVTGMDITHDPADGLDSYRLAEALRLDRPARVKYIISNGKIANAKPVTKKGKKYAAWDWSPYTGKNSHSHHVHISVQPVKVLYDDLAAWDLSAYELPDGKAEKDPILELPLLINGTRGAHVRYLQERLNGHGASLVIDEDFGDKTETAVRAFQKRFGLPADGRVGAYTWRALVG